MLYGRLRSYLTLKRLEDQLTSNPHDQISVARLVRQAEQQLNEGLQRFPEDSYLADAEARLARIIGQDKRAINALERALRANPANAFVAKALSRLYEEQSDIGRARATLEKCLEVARADKTVNAGLARLLTNHFPREGAAAEQYWRRSFTDGDANHQSQFWYARQVFSLAVFAKAAAEDGEMSMLAELPRWRLRRAFNTHCPNRLPFRLSVSVR